MIHDLPDVPPEEQEANDLLEALALRLSLTALNSGESPASPPVPDKARPPPRPTHVRPPPPFESPTLRQRVAANRLPLLFPPVGSQWNNGRLARELNPRALNPPHPGFASFPRYRVKAFSTSRHDAAVMAPFSVAHHLVGPMTKRIPTRTTVTMRRHLRRLHRRIPPLDPGSL